jgi:hypothetical protein
MTTDRPTPRHPSETVSGTRAVPGRGGRRTSRAGCVRVLRAGMLLTLSFVLAAAAGCTHSSRRVVSQLSEGTCQRQCADENPDSLYDQNQCEEQQCSHPSLFSSDE